MSIEIWDWGLGYIYLWDILIAWWGWWESWWKPNANTLAYYPLDWSLNDESWNWLNLTSSWLSWETLSSWRKVASVTNTWYLEKN